MKWTYQIPKKLKTATLLMIIVLTVVVTTFWGKSSFSELNNSFASIYEDRLLPANELFHLSDIMYQKYMILENYTQNKTGLQNVKETIEFKNKQLDSILQAYEKTYLVEEEIKSLNSFKEKERIYRKAEQEIILNELPIEKLNPLFNDIRGELITLSQIQTKVGKELMNGSEAIFSHASFIHYCQLALILIIMLVVQSIIFSARSIFPKKPQKYNLN